MPITLSSLDAAKPDTLKTAIDQMARYINQLEATILKLQAAQTTGRPLTLSEIQAGLSATGSHPLNVTGLPGTLRQDQPTKTP